MKGERSWAVCEGEKVQTRHLSRKGFPSVSVAELCKWHGRTQPAARTDAERSAGHCEITGHRVCLRPFRRSHGDYWWCARNSETFRKCNKLQVLQIPKLFHFAHPTFYSFCQMNSRKVTHTQRDSLSTRRILIIRLKLHSSRLLKTRINATNLEGSGWFSAREVAGPSEGSAGVGCRAPLMQTDSNGTRSEWCNYGEWVRGNSLDRREHGHC